MNARHARSFEAGEQAGTDGGGTGKQVAEDQAPLRVELTFKDLRSAVSASPVTDEAVLNNWKLPIDADLRQDFKNDSMVRLEGAVPLTQTQLRAIQSQEPAVVVEGGPCSGKTMVIIYRALVLLHYLSVPADEITIICTDAESKEATIVALKNLLEQWWIPNSAAIAEQIVKTLPETVLDVARSVPGLDGLRLFECSPEEEGAFNPYGLRLAGECYRQIDTFAAALYKSNKIFAQAVVDLYRRSITVDQLEADHPDVVRRSRFGLALESTDAELTAQVLALWKKAGVWPISGVTPTTCQIELCGQTFHAHGYSEQLEAFVVLGFDRSEDRHLKRNNQAKIETYKEVEIKKTLIRAYAERPVIHLDSYQQAVEFADSMKNLATTMPNIRLRSRSSLELKPLAMVAWEAASFIEMLGLEVKSAIARVSFMPRDPDALLYKVVSMLWGAFEKQMIEDEIITMTYGRVLSTFSGATGGNLRFVPMAALSKCKHILVDDAQDLSPAGAEWIRSALRELKRRALQLGAGRAAAMTTLMFAGDPVGRVYGARGATTQPLTGFCAFFGVPGSGAITLQDNFVAHQDLVDLAQGVLAQVGDASTRKTFSAQERPNARSVVQFCDFSVAEFEAKLAKLLTSGRRVLVVPDLPETFSIIANSMLPLLEAEKSKAGAKQLYVRQSAKASDVLPDVLVLVGAFQQQTPTSFSNQVFKLAGQGKGNDLAPYETVLMEDGVSGAAAAILRTKVGVIWFGPPGGGGYGPTSPLSQAKAICHSAAEHQPATSQSPL